MNNIVIRMVNRDEYHLHDTEITRIRIKKNGAKENEKYSY